MNVYALQKIIDDIEYYKHNDFSNYVQKRLDDSFQQYQKALEQIKESLSNKDSIKVLKNL